MFKHKVVILILLVLVFTGGLANCQEIVKGQSAKILKGTVIDMDAVGGIINIQTDNGQMSFSISDQTNMVRDTKDIGLLDIKRGDPVTIQYDSSSPGKNIVISLVDNQPSLAINP